MTEELRLNASITIPAGELMWQFSRSGGPGGQGVNTADSKAELRFDLAASTAIPAHLKNRALDQLDGRLVDGVIIITASEHRSQLANRKAALARLAMLLNQGIAPPAQPRRPTRPSKRQVQARLDGKRHRGNVKRMRRTPPETA